MEMDSSPAPVIAWRVIVSMSAMLGEVKFEYVTTYEEAFGFQDKVKGHRSKFVPILHLSGRTIVDITQIATVDVQPIRKLAQ